MIATRGRYHERRTGVLRSRAGFHTCPHDSHLQYVASVTSLVVVRTRLERQNGHCGGAGMCSWSSVSPTLIGTSARSVDVCVKTGGCRVRGARAPARDRAEGFDERCPEDGPKLRKAVPSSVLPKVERRKAIRGLLSGTR